MGGPTPGTKTGTSMRLQGALDGGVVRGQRRTVHCLRVPVWIVSIHKSLRVLLRQVCKRIGILGKAVGSDSADDA